MTDHSDKHEEQFEQEQNYQPEMIPCPFCYGEGTWEVECCSGASGCSCRGGLVDMGTCNVCRGSGQVEKNNHNPRANVDYLERAGACFAGSGPTSGYWANKPALGRSPKY